MQGWLFAELAAVALVELAAKALFYQVVEAVAEGLASESEMPRWRM